MRKILSCFCPNQGSQTLQEKIKTCFGICMCPPSDTAVQKTHMKMGLERMNHLVNSLHDRAEFKREEKVMILWSSLALVGYFNEALMDSTIEGFDNEISFKRSLGLFTLSVESCAEKKTSSPFVMRIITKFLTAVDLWKRDKLCSFIFEGTRKGGLSKEEIVTHLIKMIVRAYEAREKVLVHQIVEATKSFCLSEVLHYYTLKTHNCLTVMMKLHHSVFATSAFIDVDDFLREAATDCLIYFVQNIKDDQGHINALHAVSDWVHLACDSPEEVTSAGLVMLEAAKIDRIFPLRAIISDELRDTVFSMIASDNLAICRMGYLIAVEVFDRHGNKAIFFSPRIFDRRFPLDVYRLTKPDEATQPTDDELFKDINVHLQNVLQKCFNFYLGKTDILMSAYLLLCVILIENMSSSVATNTIHIAMSLQETVLRAQKKGELQRTEASAYHATIISLLSLICYLHESQCQSLCEYIDKVIDYRSGCAPYLLPPIAHGSKIRSIDVSTLDKEIYLEPAEIHMAVLKSWRHYTIMSPDWNPEFKLPPKDPNLIDKYTDYDEGPTNLDILERDQTGAFVAIKPIGFGREFTRKERRFTVEEADFPEYKEVVMENWVSVALTEPYDRFWFFADRSR